VIGGCFLILAVYVLYDAVGLLVNRAAPDRSITGIALAALSLVVMPLLARAKRRIARRLDSGALEAETRQTEICASLSAILLAGLGLNAALGWWWARSGRRSGDGPAHRARGAGGRAWPDLLRGLTSVVILRSGGPAALPRVAGDRVIRLTPCRCRLCRADG
jgi:hypothetical protein